MAIDAEAEDLQIDSAGPLDRALVPTAFAHDVWRCALQELNAARRNVDVLEQMALHERAVGAGIVRRQAEKFIEVEGGRLAEIDSSPTVKVHEFAIQRNWR